MWFPVLLAVLVLAVSDGGKCDVNAIKFVLLLSAVQALAIFLALGRIRPPLQWVAEFFSGGKAAVA
jgi:hypothetical protein